MSTSYEKVKELWKEYVEPYKTYSIFQIFSMGFSLGEKRGYTSFQVELRDLKMQMENHELTSNDVYDAICELILEDIGG